MDVLVRFGFTIDEVKAMMDTNNCIDNMNDNDIYKLIDILKSIGCSREIIRNIIICNPFYLTKNYDNIDNLIKKLYDIGCFNLNLLFDTNPYILNMSDKDLDKFYNEMLNKGLEKDEVIDYINYNIIY